MIRYFFRIAFRNFKSHKIEAFLNISGLAIAITVTLIILFYLDHEYNYDKFNANSENIYRVEAEWGLSVPTLVGHKLATSNIPGIKKCTRFFFPGDMAMKYNDNVTILTNLALTDTSVLDVFTYNFIHGNQNTALINKYSLVLTESVSKKIFGDRNPVNEQVLLGNQYVFTVTGVIEDIKHSHLQINALASITTLMDIRRKNILEYEDEWMYPTYVLLSENVQTEMVETKINNLLRPLADYHGLTFKLKKSTDIYLSKHDDQSSEKNTVHGDPQWLLAFKLIAVFMLLMAGINYMNLTTARVSTRMKETGIKKIVGSTKKQMVIQFIAESLLISILALGAALILLIIVLPIFSNLMEAELQFNELFFSRNILLLILCVLGIGGLNGIYPAFYIGSFKTGIILSLKNLKRETTSFRNTLSTCQFIFSIILISATFVVLKQLNYIKNKNLGFDKENILCLSMNKSINMHHQLFKEKLFEHPEIIDVSFSKHVPGEFWGGWGSVQIDHEGKYVITDNPVDPEYFNTLGLTLISGENFSWDIQSANESFFILTGNAIKKYKIQNPIGRYISHTGSGVKGTVIGVVNDINHQSLFQPRSPIIFHWNPEYIEEGWMKYASIKISPGNVKNAVSHIKSVWLDVCPDYPFDFKFLDKRLEAYYKTEIKLSRLLIIFTVIIIFISSLGIFGLSIFSSERRIKEIGIRKVNGAKVKEVIAMLNRDFVKWVTVAFVIATPLAWYVMRNWLRNFEYKTILSWWIFASAGMLALIVALLTVSWQSWRAARRNPVEALRYE